MIKFYIKAIIISVFFIGKLGAQTANSGQLTVMPNTQFATVSDFNNSTSGNVLNDGNFIVYSDFKNDGVVRYTEANNGTTLFVGTTAQNIEGASVSDFQNVVFDNLSSLVPFHLYTNISVGKQVDFKSGIIDAASYNGKVIFKEKAIHIDVSNLSFVDGKVEKRGVALFEFPVGDDLFFRPSFHGVGTDANNVYVTQYFFDNAGSTHPYTSKEDIILAIDEVEYWNTTQSLGSEKIVLSLSLDPATTPEAFFTLDPKKKLSIVRWDTVLAKWVDEGGITSNPNVSGSYSKLVTSQVKGYGIFTVGIVNKPDINPNFDIIVNNAISPNGDGINDSFFIQGINKYPDNRVEIYNRWGVKVFDAQSYNESDNMFTGYSDGRVTVNKGAKLPTGTYFYILKYNNGRDGIESSGYLYINNQ